MKKNSHLVLLLTLLSLLAFSLTACRAQPQTITVSGAFALYPLMNRWADEYQKTHPQVQFDISAGGAGKGMADALAGAVDIGMVSRQVTAEEEARGAFWMPVAKDAVFPTMSALNPVREDLLARGLSQETLVGIFITGEITTWGQAVGRPDVTDQIVVYTRSDACGAAETFAQFLGAKQEDLLGVAVFGDPGLLDAVARDPLGIGYNNLGYAYDAASGLPVEGTLTLPIDRDRDGRASSEELLETKTEAIQMVAEGKYPSPPARDLYLVTLGKPTGIALEFLRWALTEGQQYVIESGYVTLTPGQIEAALQQLQ
jgi:phosphate transport system substrate-binding protein